MYISHFMYSLVDRHLGCFYLLIIMNNAAMDIDILVQVPIWMPVSIFWEHVLGHMESLMGLS